MANLTQQYFEMEKDRRNRDEIVKAFKKSVELRSQWEAALASGISREEMEKMGLHTIDVQDA